MSVLKHYFRKKPMKRFRELFWSVNFGPKNNLFSPSWPYQEYSWKILNCQFYPIFNAWLIKRLVQKCYFRPNNGHFTPFGRNKDFPRKMSFFIFNFCVKRIKKKKKKKKKKKRNGPFLRKRYRRTEFIVEFIGPPV